MSTKERPVPFFGARKFASGVLSELDEALRQRDDAQSKLRDLGGLSLLEIGQKRKEQEAELENVKREIEDLKKQVIDLKQKIVITEDTALLQEAGVYSYFHPLTNSVSYQSELDAIQEQVKAMTKKDGGSITATTTWTVNGSPTQGRAMVRDISKLMLRAFNAEADNLVRSLKPYKVQGAIDRLNKVAETIEKLGKSMDIRVSAPYKALRILELQITSDFLQKQAEEKELERAERERLKEERRAQQEIEREKARLEKEKQHYLNALSVLEAKGDLDGASRLREQISDVDKAIQDVEYRAANIRAGYVYVISNIGSFGDSIVKVGMTRRLDPMDRIRELSDASVPFNFDVHALFFSNDAVGIETSMHNRLAQKRCNLINLRREFFYATPSEAKSHLAELTGELLTFQDLAEALEYRQTVSRRAQINQSVSSGAES